MKGWNGREARFWRSTFFQSWCGLMSCSFSFRELFKNHDREQWRVAYRFIFAVVSLVEDLDGHLGTEDVEGVLSDAVIASAGPHSSDGPEAAVSCTAINIHINIQIVGCTQRAYDL